MRGRAILIGEVFLVVVVVVVVIVVVPFAGWESPNSSIVTGDSAIDREFDSNKKPPKTSSKTRHKSPYRPTVLPFPFLMFTRMMLMRMRMSRGRQRLVMVQADVVAREKKLHAILTVALQGKTTFYHYFWSQQWYVCVVKTPKLAFADNENRGRKDYGIYICEVNKICTNNLCTCCDRQPTPKYRIIVTEETMVQILIHDED